jgi:hypothetical protein
VLAVVQVRDAEQRHLDAVRRVLLELLPLLLRPLAFGERPGGVGKVVLVGALLHFLPDRLLHLGRVGHGLLAQDGHEVLQLELGLLRGDDPQRHLVSLLLLPLGPRLASHLLPLLR